MKKTNTIHVQIEGENHSNNDFVDFPSTFKNEIGPMKKIARRPQVLRKHITWRNFLKESFARNKVFKIFMERVNEKAYLILISLFFHQNFE